MQGTIRWKYVALSAVLVLLAGCAGSRTYLLNVSYNPVGVSFLPGVAAKTVTVAVYNFQDGRAERGNIGQRIYPDGMIDIYKLDSGSVEQLVTRSAAMILEKAGFQVKRVDGYLDPAKMDFKDIGADAALGGKIEVFRVDAKKSGVTTWDTDARLRFQINWGIPKSRTWSSQVIEGSAQESDRPFYGFKNAQAKINEVFKDAMDKLIKDEKALREILPAK
jgi:hypothetical protein